MSVDEMAQAGEATSEGTASCVRLRRRMPCGAAVCLRCHGDCGPQRAGYILDGWGEDDDSTAGDAESADSKDVDSKDIESEGVAEE